MTAQHATFMTSSAYTLLAASRGKMRVRGYEGTISCGPTPRIALLRTWFLLWRPPSLYVYPQPAELAWLRRLNQPPELVRRIFDTILILLRLPLLPVEVVDANDDSADAPVARSSPQALSTSMSCNHLAWHARADQIVRISSFRNSSCARAPLHLRGMSPLPSMYCAIA